MHTHKGKRENVMCRPLFQVQSDAGIHFNKSKRNLQNTILHKHSRLPQARAVLLKV